jgi:hypothetical protein
LESIPGLLTNIKIPSQLELFIQKKVHYGEKQKKRHLNELRKRLKFAKARARGWVVTCLGTTLFLP